MGEIRYIGKFEVLPKMAEYGDFLWLIPKNDFYIYRQRWIKYIPLHDLNWYERQLNKLFYSTKGLKPAQCTCCGAPLHKYKCDYCGTVYRLER